MDHLQIYHDQLQQLCGETFKQRCDFLFSTAWVMIVATVVVKIKRELCGTTFPQVHVSKISNVLFWAKWFFTFKCICAAKSHQVVIVFFTCIRQCNDSWSKNRQQVSSRVLYFKVLSPWIKHLYFSCPQYSGDKDHGNVIPFNPPFLPL